MSAVLPRTLLTDVPPAPRPVTPVGILAATLDRVAAGLATVPGLDPDLLADLMTARELATGLEPYLSRWTVPESPSLRHIAQRTAAENWSSPTVAHGSDLEQEMLSGHVEGQFLKMLVRVTHARRVLDVGMFTGYSALAMAEALPLDGVVVACELDRRAASVARECFRESPDGPKIDIRMGPAQDTLAALAAAGDTFDMIFIDADKPGYAAYLSAILDAGLLAVDGVLCADNTLLQGQPWLSDTPSANGAAVAAFNRAVAEDARVEQVIVPLRDGLTLICRVDDVR